MSNRNIKRSLLGFSVLSILLMALVATAAGSDRIIDENGPIVIDYGEYTISAHPVSDERPEGEEIVEISFDDCWSDLDEEEQEECLADIIWRAEIGHPVSGPLENFLRAWSKEAIRTEMDKHGSESYAAIFASQGNASALESYGNDSLTPLSFHDGYILESTWEPVEGQRIVRMIIINPALARSYVENPESLGELSKELKDYALLNGIESFDAYANGLLSIEDRISFMLDCWNIYQLIDDSDSYYPRVCFNAAIAEKNDPEKELFR